jgi:hypothetical protein
VRYIDGNIDRVALTLGRNDSVLQAYENVRKREGLIDVRKIAAGIKVDKVAPRNDAELQKLVRQILDTQMLVNINRSISLDADRYEVVIETVSSSYFFYLSDRKQQPDGSQSPDPIIIWLNEVKRCFL